MPVYRAPALQAPLGLGGGASSRGHRPQHLFCPQFSRNPDIAGRYGLHCALKGLCIFSAGCALTGLCILMVVVHCVLCIVRCWPCESIHSQRCEFTPHITQICPGPGPDDRTGGAPPPLQARLAREVEKKSSGNRRIAVRSIEHDQCGIGTSFLLLF